MKTLHFFHPNTCMLWDCALGRYCSCGAKGLRGPDADSPEKAYQDASDWLGNAPELDDERIVDTLYGCQEVDGAVHVTWQVRGRNEDKAAFEYVRGGFLVEEDEPRRKRGSADSSGATRKTKAAPRQNKPRATSRRTAGRGAKQQKKVNAARGSSRR